MNTTYSQNDEAHKAIIEWNAWTVITFFICIAVPLLIGATSSFFTQDAMYEFNTMIKPPLAPPAWLFPVAWTILYILMGIASFFIIKSTDEARGTGLLIYIIQLGFNFGWSLIFFNLQLYVFSVIWLAILLAMIIGLIINTSKYSKPAMYMLIPYAAWCCFAMYLNISIAMLN